MQIDAAYLIVKRFNSLYAEYAQNPKYDKAIYALPLFNTTPEHAPVKYHGLDRDPLQAYKFKEALAAEIRMAELEKLDRCVGAYLFDPHDVEEVLGWVEEEIPGTYEVAWARRVNAAKTPPDFYMRLGYEASWFPDGYFSASCDCLCFPRWHGTDPMGILFNNHFLRLNKYGLFDSAVEASNFIDYYTSFDWTEEGDYEIIEVWDPVSKINQFQRRDI